MPSAQGSMPSAQGTAEGSGSSKETHVEVLETSDYSSLSILSPIGHGGFAVVWMARWQGNDLAVKVLKVAHESFDAPEVAREVAILRRLRHPCICALFGLTRVEQRPALVLEYMGGGSLAKYLFHRKLSSPCFSSDPIPDDATRLAAERGAAGGGNGPVIFTPLAVGTAEKAAAEKAAAEKAAAEIKKIGFAVQLASGLCFLHSHGILHCDVKTDNALLDRTHSACKLVDFGLASLSLNSRDHSKVVGVAGTLRYLAPERAEPMALKALEDDEELDSLEGHLSASYRYLSVSSLVSGSRIADGRPLLELEDRVDVYAFGLLLWEISHERRAFKDLVGAGALMAACRGERPLISLPPNCDRIGGLMRECWAPIPQKRPSMSTVLERLERCMQAEAPADFMSMTRVAQCSDPPCSASSTCSAAGSDHTAKLGDHVQWMPEATGSAPYTCSAAGSDHTAKLGDHVQWMPEATGSAMSGQEGASAAPRMPRLVRLTEGEVAAHAIGSSTLDSAHNGGLLEILQSERVPRSEQLSTRLEGLELASLPSDPSDGQLSALASQLVEGLRLDERSEAW